MRNRKFRVAVGAEMTTIRNIENRVLLYENLGLSPWFMNLAILNVYRRFEFLSFEKKTFRYSKSLKNKHLFHFCR
jgi:hypothetical protein